jgi:hypothetical protein
VEGLDPDELTLFYWDTESDSWASDGIEVIAHNVANRTITLAISHLTEFGLFSQADPGVPDDEDKIYIPSLSRQEDEK